MSGVWIKVISEKRYDNLVTVDLVCHGTPSPKLWKKYLDEQKDKYHSEIDDIVFRNKTYGYHSGTMRIRFKNQFVYYGSARVDSMLKSFFAEISSRPSCYKCRFKSVERCSDFVAALPVQVLALKVQLRWFLTKKVFCILKLI